MACRKHDLITMHFSLWLDLKQLKKACKPKIWIEKVISFIEESRDECFNQYFRMEECTCPKEDTTSESNATLGSDWLSAATTLSLLAANAVVEEVDSPQWVNQFYEGYDSSEPEVLHPDEEEAAYQAWINQL